MIKKLAIAGLGTFALLGVLSAPSYRVGESIKPQKNRATKVIMVPAFEWHIMQEDDMRRLYERSGGGIALGGDLKGFAARDPVTGRQMIFTTEPRRVDDEVTMTIGHEVLHLAYGDYHR